MARLAIFIDGGYIDAIARREAGVRVDLQKLVTQVAGRVQTQNAEALDLFRSFYYTCPPYQHDPPSPEDRERARKFSGFRNALERLPRFEVRLGRLQRTGVRDDGSPAYGQKQVDLLLGLDIALLSGKQQITHAALVAGDRDFVPALVAVKREGVSAWLFHGPDTAADDGKRTYAEELWLQADDRVVMDSAFWDSVSL